MTRCGHAVLAGRTLPVGLARGCTRLHWKPPAVYPSACRLPDSQLHLGWQVVGRSAACCMRRVPHHQPRGMRKGDGQPFSGPKEFYDRAGRGARDHEVSGGKGEVDRRVRTVGAARIEGAPI